MKNSDPLIWGDEIIICTIFGWYGGNSYEMLQDMSTFVKKSFS
jgi:hypothetical protein